jgi:lysophospholipase L1-like esterase
MPPRRPRTLRMWLRATSAHSAENARRMLRRLRAPGVPGARMKRERSAEPALMSAALRGGCRRKGVWCPGPRPGRASQLEAALAFRPDLAIVSAGGNDSLRRSFSPDAVERELDAIVGPLRRADADVLMLEPMDIVASGLVPAEHAGPLDERTRRLAELTRTVARRHGAILVEMRRQPASAVPGVYARDRLHLNARGHAIVGSEAVRALNSAIPARAAA